MLRASLKLLTPWSPTASCSRSAKHKLCLEPAWMYVQAGFDLGFWKAESNQKSRTY